MSITKERSSPSSTISSNYQSPVTTHSTKTKVNIAKMHPDLTFAKILLHILSENKNQKITTKK